MMDLIRSYSTGAINLKIAGHSGMVMMMNSQNLVMVTALN